MSDIILTFDYASYIANPTFELYSAYAQPLLQLYWDNAIVYMSDVASCGNLQDEKREYAIQLLMSHLIFVTNVANTGNGAGTGGGTGAGTVPYQLQSATIDKVSVSTTPPPNKNQFQWWLGTSPFGQQLLALLSIVSVGGNYYPGSFGRLGFRAGWF